MKAIILKIFVIFQIFLIFQLLGCSKDDNSTNNNTTKSSLKGEILDINGAPIPQVIVTAGNLQALTDPNGLYTIPDVPVNDRLLISYSKTGYVSTQKIGKIEAGKFTTVNVTLITVDKITKIAPLTGGYAKSNGAEVTIVPNSYTDTVKLYATYIDCTQSFYDDAIPGEKLGIDSNNIEVAIDFLGYFDLESYSGTNKVQLLSGKQARLSFPIKDSTISYPAKVKMWYYDENVGKWKEEGVANQISKSFIGAVSHLTKWGISKSN
jgi:hypothetical protein